MENPNKEYMDCFHNYIVAILLWKFFRKGTSINDYIQIERTVAHKYKMEENIFRTKKRACDFGSLII